LSGQQSELTLENRDIHERLESGSADALSTGMDPQRSLTGPNLIVMRRLDTRALQVLREGTYVAPKLHAPRQPTAPPESSPPPAQRSGMTATGLVVIGVLLGLMASGLGGAALSAPLPSDAAAQAGK
jgi:hypothetical protein